MPANSAAGADDDFAKPFSPREPAPELTIILAARNENTAFRGNDRAA